jgi:FkbM family methyltransferase
MTKFVTTLKDGSKLEIPYSAGDIIIDCGANVGDISVPFAAGGATVIAFEPNTTAYQVLTERLNGYNNVKCYNSAVSTYNGTANLYLHEHASSDPVAYSSGCSLQAEKTNVNVEDYEEVKVVDLCEAIGKIKKVFNRNIHILKIDIEGAECELMEKLMDEDILREIPNVFVETHEKKNPAFVDATKKMIERAAKEGLTNINFNWI